MSARDEILNKIKKQAKRRSEKRIESNSNKTVEAFIFDFFKDAEVILSSHLSDLHKSSVLLFAKESLKNKIRTIDNKCLNVDVIWNNVSEPPSIQGVKISWSTDYQNANNIGPEFYVDISEMLFI